MKDGSNSRLQKLYEQVYQQGEDSFFSRFSSGRDDSENDDVVLAAVDWAGKSVLDVGCGTGHTAAAIARAGAKEVTGIDYAPTAVATANDMHHELNLRFEVLDIAGWTRPIDVAISCGTLEHMDRPEETLRDLLRIVGPKGEVVITCPFFINIRGLVWMTLAKLFGVPMSLTDRHFISPFDIERWLEGTTHHLARTVAFDFDRANGRRMLEDMEKRLTNALRDAALPYTRVPDLISWLREVVAYHERAGAPSLGGRNALYYIAPVTENT